MKMFIGVLGAVLTVSLVQPLQAQRIALGARGGVTVASADVEGSIFGGDVGTTTGFHGGPLVNVEISRFFAMQTQFLFSQKGFDRGDGEVSIDVSYLEIPVLATIQIPLGRISPHMYLGPVLGLENNCTGTTPMGGEENCEDAIRAPQTKGADFGIMAGGGLEVQGFGPGSVLLDVLYNYGLTDIAQFSDDVDSVKLRTIYLSLGYVFPIGQSYP